jgi:hypothetical protein
VAVVHVLIVLMLFLSVTIQRLLQGALHVPVCAGHAAVLTLLRPYARQPAAHVGASQDL